MIKKTHYTFKDLKKDLMKDPRYRAMSKRLEKQWDFKMHDDVMNFVIDIGRLINWKAKTYGGGEIEERVWKLLKKARRLS